MRVLVTGASRGLGLALCQELSARGDEVLATVRAASPELDLPGVEVLEGIDVAADDAAQRLRAAIGGRALDVVIANAGVNWSFASGIEELDVALLRSEFEVNTFGVVRTVQAALPSMGEGGKIAIISTWRPGGGAARRN
jgi:NAD(P)-dependent dehydrogenase (short-subunit alcohol dehydrogenase family)